MNIRQGKRSLHTLTTIVLTMLGCLGIPFPAEAVGPSDLPPVTTPGGALPFRDEESREPREGGPEVPSLKDQERPRIPDTGVRMNVKEFILKGVVDHPERGVTLEDLQQRVEAMRQEHTQGFTLSELQEVTDEITRVYRSGGYILARAYIPEQKVTDGRVVIEILEGELEQLVFQGNQKYSEERLKMPFDGLVGKPVNRVEIERALLELSDYPGLTFNSVFSPGDTTGTAKLGLNVENEDRFDGALWLDNYGSEFTGEYRLWADVTMNNPTGAADRLSAQVLTSMGEENGGSDYYALGYHRPIFGHRNIAGLDISHNTYDVGGDFDELDLNGESTIMTASLRRGFIRSRDFSLEGRFSLSTKESSSELSVLTIGEDKLTVLSLGAAGNVRDGWSGYTQAAMHYSIGLPGAMGAMDEDGDGNSSRTGGSGDRAGGDFGKINLNLARWQPFSSIQLLKNQTLLTRLDVQSSSDLLVSMEQMSLGGPNSVRAYPASEYLVDSGQFLSLEWIAKASGSASEGKFFEGLQFSVFYDYASGKLNDPLPNDVDSPELQGYGASVQISPKNKYLARLDLATSANDPEPSNDRSVQYFFKFGYLF